MFAVVDIETTGGSYRYEEIIEIGIVLHDGEKITDKFSSLIKPGILIPHHITRLTGISNDMVKDAPKFFEVAKKIVEMTEDRVFVAHNVNFDYGFIRKAFSDLGFNFSRKKLCTVRYGKKLFPGMESYSLAKLTEHFDIDIGNHHRALSDAVATAKLLSKYLEEDSKNLFKKALRKNDVLVDMHEHLSPEVVKKLPKAAGVYFFYDKDYNLIYVGKSVNIHDRIIAHLNNDKSSRYLEMKNAIADIKYELCGNDLIAQLRESELIKKYKPFFNRVLKQDSFHFGIYVELDTRGYKQLSIKKGKDQSGALMTFASRDKAKSFIGRLQARFGICYSETNMNLQNQCLKFLNNSCAGVCENAIEPSDYNSLFDEIIADLQFPDGRYYVELEGREKDEASFVLFDKKKYKGFGFFHKKNDQPSWDLLSELIVSNRSDYDSHLILRSFFYSREMNEKAL